MIEITIKRNSNEDIIDFTIGGHAQAAEYGEDIVCAGVSSIVQTALFGLCKYLELEFEYKVEEGFISVRLNDNLAANKEVKAILETMLIGLEETKKEYSQYINFTIEGGGEYV